MLFHNFLILAKFVLFVSLQCCVCSCVSTCHSVVGWLYVHLFNITIFFHSILKHLITSNSTTVYIFVQPCQRNLNNSKGLTYCHHHLCWCIQCYAKFYNKVFTFHQDLEDIETTDQRNEFLLNITSGIIKF